MEDLKETKDSNEVLPEGILKTEDIPARKIISPENFQDYWKKLLKEKDGCPNYGAEDSAD